MADKAPEWLREAARIVGMAETKSSLLIDAGYIVSPRLSECIDAPLVPQRSAEWFELRKQRITGSIVDTILKTNPFGDYAELVCEKAGMPVVFTGNAATAHGTKYEPVAIEEYIRRTGRHVIELGVTPHATTPLLAHSPDGISLSKTEEPVLLEIKCPLTRPIKPGKVPPYYMGQLQMGMDLFDVNNAHFVQYRPASDLNGAQFDLTIVPRDEGWLEKNMAAFVRFWDEVEHWRQVGWTHHPKYALIAQLRYLRETCVL